MDKTMVIADKNYNWKKKKFGQINERIFSWISMEKTRPYKNTIFKDLFLGSPLRLNL